MKRKISQLKLWDKNPRDIKPKKLELLKKYIQKYGLLSPLKVTPDGEVLGGNHRLKAIKELGWDEVWVKEVKPKNDKEKLEIALIDNQEFANYIQDELQQLVLDTPELELDDFSITLNTTPLTDLMPEDEIVEDEAPELDEESVVSKLGEVYQLGRHRLMCGDSTKIEDVEKLTLLSRVNLEKLTSKIVAIIDPPYGISLVKDGKVGADFGVAKKGNYEPIIGDGDISIARETFDVLSNITDRIIIFGGNYFLDFLPPSDGWLIWDKRGDSGIRNTFADGEMAWCSFHTPVRIYKQLWNGMIREGEKEKRVHPTQKPIDLLSRIIKDFTESDDIVLDLFGGSGSTLIACEQTDRTCYMCELDPKYCDVIRKRYWKLVDPDNWEEKWQK